MKSIVTKFLLPVLLLAAALMTVDVHLSYSHVQEEVTKLMDRQAALALAFDLAIRSYVAEEIRPVMEERIADDEFIPEAMSTSYVARSVFEKVRQDFPDYRIRFSSDNPRNPTNQAGRDELRMIEYFNDHPEIDKWTGHIELDGQPYVAHFSARRMKESCLRCHGQPEDAPTSLVQRYGSTAGFHRPVGKVIALDTVAIPTDRIRATVIAGMARHAASMAVGFAFLVLMIALVFRFVVARRLATMGTHFEQLAEQPEKAPIAPMEVRGRDEISSLARSFNALADKVRNAYASLEHRVAERTTELATANRELEAEIAERRRSETQLAHDAAYRTGMNELLRLALRATSLDELLGSLLEVLLSLEFLPARDKGAVFLAKGDSGMLLLKAQRNLCEPLHTLCAEVPFGRCLCGRAAASGEIQHAADVDQDHDIRFDGMMPHGHYVVPLRSETGTIGVVVLYLPAGTKRRDEDVRFLSAVADVIAGALQRLTAENELRQTNAMLLDALQREKRAALELESTMEQLEAAKQDAEAATQAKSEFLANTSHEIRTPMTAILGFADVLLEQGNFDQAPPERIEAIRTIKRNGEYLLGLINDILDLSKIEAGKVTVERLVCSPCQIIAEVDSLIRVRSDAKGLRLDVEYEGAIPETIQTDPTRLRQILINVLSNAVKFTEVGGVRLITRFVDTDTHGPTLEFDIVDTGVGMTKEQVARLFRPFTQADASTTRKFGGTGLGLTISKRLAEKLDGDVQVMETAPGVGTRFRVIVGTGPLDGVRMLGDARSVTVFATEATTGPSLPERTRRLDCHILLAEDGPDNQRLIAHVLRKAGAEVTVVENGKLALDAALAARERGNPFDVILMDMHMPVMDGYEATGLLREKGYSGPIIALTAHSMAGDREKCIQTGCDEYATKPIDRTVLIEAIRACACRVPAQ